MELTSERFREAVHKIVHSSTPVLGTLHQRYASDLIPELRDAEDLQIFRLTARNRDALPYLLSRRISALLSR
jgi:nucleoside-triphosphatase THEP1